MITPWSPKDLKTLRKLYDEGEAFAAISDAMGGRHSPNSCIGKAHRLGLTPRREGTPRRKKPIELPAFIPPREEMPAPPPKPPNCSMPKLRIEDPRITKARATSLAKVAVNAKTDAERIAEGVSFFALRASQCRWPLNEVSPLSGLRYCGQKIFARSYCVECYARSLQITEREAQRLIAEAAE